MRKLIQYEGSTWEVWGEGTVDEEKGLTYCHLASTTKFFQQRNGKRPAQVGDWIPSHLLEAASADA